MLDEKCINKKCPMSSMINDRGCIAKFEVWANCDMTGYKPEDARTGDSLGSTELPGCKATTIRGPYRTAVEPIASKWWCDACGWGEVGGGDKFCPGCGREIKSEI